MMLFFISPTRCQLPTRRTLLLPVLLGLGVATAVPAFAQREVRRLSAVSVTAGISSTASYYQGTYGRFLSDPVRFEVSGAVEQGPRTDSRAGEDQSSFRGYELGIGVAPRLLRLGEILYLRLPFQVRTRYERLPPTGPAREDGFSVGPSLGLSAEVYLHDRVSVTGEARQGWYPVGSPQNSTPRYVGGGLTLYLGQ